jgi:hypothetical protein
MPAAPMPPPPPPAESASAASGGSTSGDPGTLGLTKDKKSTEGVTTRGALPGRGGGDGTAAIPPDDANAGADRADDDEDRAVAPAPTIKITGGLRRSDVASLLSTPAIAVCWTAGTRATVILQVDPDGSIAVVTPDRMTLTVQQDGANGAAANCVRRALAGVKLPERKKKSTIVLSR